jgi:hypothetical protein
MKRSKVEFFLAACCVSGGLRRKVGLAIKCHSYDDLLKAEVFGLGNWRRSKAAGAGDGTERR